MSERVVLKSNDSRNVYPSNKTYDFRVHLPKPLQFLGNWEVSLTEFTYQGAKKSVEPELLICCDLVDDGIVGDREEPLLRRVFLNRRLENLIFEQPYAVHLKTGIFQDVHVYIKTFKHELASFLTGQVTVTLQFKRVFF